MTLLTRLERSIGWAAIGHLPLYIVTAQAILYVWLLLNPEGAHLLSMDPYAVLHEREYWRVITFLFVVPFQNPLWAFLYLYFQYICGMALEEEWGSFPVTMFYLVGAMGALAAAFIVGVDMQHAFFFNEAIFLAFAALFPNFQILLFFILPIKVKWLAWFTWLRIVLTMVGVPLVYKVAILVSLIHYFLFFGPLHVRQVRERIMQWKHRRQYKDWNQ